MKKKKHGFLALLLALVLAAGVVGCSNDDNPNQTPGPTGTAGGQQGGQEGEDGQEAVGIVNAMVNYLRDPVGIDTLPYFSWNMESKATGAAQSAYEIRVSTDENVAGDAGLVWDSGKIDSNKSVNLAYEGPALQSSTRYYWQVTVWDQAQTQHQGEVASFETALLEEDAWEDATWIKAPSSTQSDRSSLHYTLEMDVQILDRAVGILFSSADAANCYMWQLNVVDHTDAAGNPILYLRPHIWTNGNYELQEYSVENVVSAATIQKQMVHVLIDVTAQEIKTYLNGSLANTYRNSATSLGLIGFRSSGPESALLDNMVYTDLSGGGQRVIASYDFESSNPFSQGTLQDGKLSTRLPSDAMVFDESFSGETGGIPMFRKEFAVEKELESVKVYATALGIYDLYLNGKRVGNDEMKPGWTDYTKRVLYYTYDVTDMMVSGTNVIGAMVSDGWWSGRISYGYYGNEDPGFLAKILLRYKDGSSQWVNTDTTWEAIIGGPIREADIWDGETYDANYVDPRWMEAGFSGTDGAKAAGWTAASRYRYRGTVSAHVGTTVQVREELSRTPESITVYEGTENTGTDYGAVHVIGTYKDGETITLAPGQTAVFDMGQNMVGWPKISVKGEQYTLLTIHFGEMLNDTGAVSRGNDGPAGSVYTANYRTAASTGKYVLSGAADGETYMPSMTFSGFRYVSVTTTQTVEISSLRGMVLGSANEETGTLETSEQSVNQLYSNIVWGQRSNYLSVPTDCPQRDERAGWTGDTHMFAGAAAYNANVAAFFQKWLQDCRDSQWSNGAYTDVVPTNSAIGGGNVAWADAGIIVPYTMYRMYGDLSILEASYASMEAYMGYMAGGGLGGRGSAYGDWLAYESTDIDLICCAYYAYDAMLMAEMSKALGYTDKAASYEALYEQIKGYFCNKYYRPTGGLRIRTQTAYILALKLDLVPSADAREQLIQDLTEKIAKNGYKLSTGFVGTGYLPLTLSQVGLSDLAYTLLLQRDDPSWLYSVDQGATTIWERWNSYTLANGFGNVGMNSFNHYAYGAVSQWMYQYMAGIAPDDDAPGFQHFYLQPQPDTRSEDLILDDQEKITWVRATYQSMYGTIVSAWSTAADAGGLLRYEATVPPNSSATMTLPLISDAAASLEINGTVYALGDLQNCNVPGVTFVSQENGTVVLELVAGSYTFVVK